MYKQLVLASLVLVAMGLQAARVEAVVLAAGRHSGNLYSLNLTNAQVTQIGASNVLGQGVLGLEFATDGNLYGIGSSNVLRINPTTGATTTLAAHGLGSITGDLSLSPSGVLYGVLDNDVFTVNTTTGAITVLTSNNGLTYMSGLGFSGSTLYVTEASGGSDSLNIISDVDGSFVSTVGVLGTPGTLGAQGIDDQGGTYYMVDDYQKRLYTLNLANGNITQVGMFNTNDLIESIAISAVPEPTTLAIWGTLGGLGLIAARRRRKA